MTDYFLTCKSDIKIELSALNPDGTHNTAAEKIIERILSTAKFLGIIDDDKTFDIMCEMQANKFDLFEAISKDYLGEKELILIKGCDIDLNVSSDMKL